jgi:hypothetical protein
VTAVDGRFRLEHEAEELDLVVRRGPVDLVIHGPTAARAGVPIVLRVDPEDRTAVGVVVDEAGEALAEVRVELFVSTLARSEVLLRTRTDGRGRFEIRGLPRDLGDLRLRATKAGFGSVEEAIEDDTRLVLRRDPVVRGTVAGAASWPIVIKLDDRQIELFGRTEFRYDEVAQGRRTLSVHAGMRVHFRELDIEEGEEQVLAITLEDRSAIEGRILRAGAPVVGVGVRLRCDHLRDRRPTDDDGRFSFPDLAPETCRVEVGSTRRRLELAPGAREWIEIELPESVVDQ